MQSSFSQKLKDLKYLFPETEDTQCLQNTRLNDKYLIFDLIAVGSHSLIYYGIEEVSGEERAFKCYNLKEIQNMRSFKEKQLCKRLSNYEYQIMDKCNSMHILKCYDIFENRDCKVLVLEYCNMGSLSDQILKMQAKHISEQQAVRIIKNIISGLKSLHQNAKRFHKNLKAKNILNKNGIYKIIDFGLPVVMNEEEQNSQDNFMIPEIVLKKGYDQKAEVWSVGVLLYEILFCEKPHALTHHNTKSYLISSSVKSIFKKLENYYSENVYNFLERCLSTDPNDRMSWKEMEEHPLLALNKIEDTSVINLSQVESQSMHSRISQILPIHEEIQYPTVPNNELASSASIYQQRFMLDLQKRQIDKQLQKVYVKLGDSIQISKIKSESISVLKQNINKKEYQSFKQLSNYYIQCLKADFFYNDIVKVIKDLPFFQQNRNTIEFMFLLISRCFFQISYINSLSKKGDDFLLRCIKKETAKLYDSISNSWLQYSNKLQNQENKWLSIISDGLSKFRSSQKYVQKERFFVGIEGEDYTREEQIQYTVQLFWDQIEQQLQKNLNEIIKRKKCQWNYQKQEKRVTEMMKYLRIYSEIWNLSLQSNNYSSLQEYVDLELLKQN